MAHEIQLIHLPAHARTCMNYNIIVKLLLIITKFKSLFGPGIYYIAQISSDCNS